MLYWICPECGRECSPAVRECPTCTAATAGQPEPTQTATDLATVGPTPANHVSAIEFPPDPALASPIQPSANLPPANHALPNQTSANHALVSQPPASYPAAYKAPVFRIDTSQELLSLAQKFQPPPSATLLTAAPQRQLLAISTDSSVALEDEPTVELTRDELAELAKDELAKDELIRDQLINDEPAITQPVASEESAKAQEPRRPAKAPEPAKPQAPPAPELSKSLAPLDSLAARPASPPRSTRVEQSPAPVPAPLSSPAMLPAAAPTPAEFGLALAGSSPAREISFQAARSGETALLEPPLEPLPSQRRSVAFVRAELRSADRAGLAVADPDRGIAQHDTTQLQPLVPHWNGRLKDSAPLPPGSESAPCKPLAYKTANPCLVTSRLGLAGESLTDLLNALKASAEERERAGIQAIHASLCVEPAMRLLSAPAEIVTAPAPPATQWMRSPKPKFTPVAPQNGGHSGLVIGPRTPTLAGPNLPRHLISLDLRNSSLRPNRRRPSWLVSLLFVIVVILGAVALLQYLTQDRDTTAASVAAPVKVVKAAPAPVRVLEEHPAARSVEVSGVRVVTGLNKRPQLEYIVVNHSANEISGLNIRIAVRSVDSSDGDPLFSVSNVVASLGPNQSKEIRTDLDSSIDPSTLPDWQSLRTEVTIARQ